jgi:benzoyl-CoA reductase/2-hydroxyglutaryl-CoA dehydratase subunit BcrC/BadD/HgdB
MKLEKRLEKLRNQLNNFQTVIWENEYKVDEKATRKACANYIRLRDEYKRLASRG